MKRESMGLKEGCFTPVMNKTIPHRLKHDGQYLFICWLTTKVTQMTNLESTPNFRGVVKCILA